MAESGRLKGAHNVKLFEEFISQHNQKNDWHKYVSPGGKKIKRGLVCEECGFGKSALIQNESLKAKFKELESDLGQRGILVTKSSQSLQVSDFEQFDQMTFIKSFEVRIAKFKDDADMLKKLLDEYSKELDKLN